MRLNVRFHPSRTLGYSHIMNRWQTRFYLSFIESAFRHLAHSCCSPHSCGGSSISSLAAGWVAASQATSSQFFEAATHCKWVSAVAPECLGRSPLCTHCGRFRAACADAPPRKRATSCEAALPV